MLTPKERLEEVPEYIIYHVKVSGLEDKEAIHIASRFLLRFIKKHNFNLTDEEEAEYWGSIYSHNIDPDNIDKQERDKLRRMDKQILRLLLPEDKDLIESLIRDKITYLSNVDIPS